MNKTEIKVSCVDQVLKITEAPIVASGGLNEIRVVFSFCEKWDGFAKTAIFYRDDEPVYFAILDENDTCIVPWEVCYEEGTFNFGVFGDKGDTRRTALESKYKVKKGAITADTMPSDPTPAVYDQIMAVLAEIRDSQAGFISVAEKAVVDANAATEEAQRATANADTATANANKATQNANSAASNANAEASKATKATEDANTATANANRATDDVRAATEAVEAALADVRNALEVSTPAIVCEASGEVISAADASDRPLKGLSIYGKTVQNGTPTPENPVPLESVGADGAICVTVAGKNLFGGIALADKLVEVASSTKDISAGTVTISGANVAHNPMLFDGAFKENTQYTIVLYGRNNVETGDATNLNIFYTDGTNEDIRFPKVSGDRYGVFTTAAGKTVSHIYCRYQSGISILYYDQCGIFEGVLTEADFEPYKGQTLTASTPNGLHGIDSVTDEIDFARGVRVQRLGTVVFDGSADETWNYGNSYIDYPNSSTLYARIWTPLSAIGVASDSFALCDKLSNYGVGLNYAPKHGAELWTNYTNFHVLPGKDYLASENSIETMRQWLSDNPITVLYELETPIETPLTAEELAQYAALHSNKPNTTVFNDGGAGMKLSYVADTKTYIDLKLAAISAALLNT